MRNIIYLLISSVFIVSGCGNRNETTSQISEDSSFTESSEIIANDIFIRANTDALTKSPSAYDLSSEDLATAKAAIYRFYSHVKVVDGYYVCDAFSGEELNMTEETFKLYLDDMNKTNESVRKLREEGKNVIMPEITDKMLESLLE